MSSDIHKLILPVFETINENKRAIVICREQDEAIELYNLLCITSSIFAKAPFEPLIIYHDDYEPFSEISPSAESLSLKVESLSRLAKGGEFNVIIIPIRAFTTKTIPKDFLIRNLITFRVGENINQKEVIDRLLRAGYVREGVVDIKGRFSIRGELIDVFGINQRFPARIVLLGSLIEKIKLFDVVSQRGFKEIDNYEVIPVNEFILDDDLRLSTIENIKAVASENGLFAQKIKEYIDLLDTSFEYGLKEYFLPFMYNYKCSSLFDYLPDIRGINPNISLFCTNRDELIVFVREYYELIKSNYSEILHREKIVPPFDTFVVNQREVESILFSCNEPDALGGEPDVEPIIAKLTLYAKKKSNISFNEVKTELESLLSKYKRVIFVYKNEEQRLSMKEIFELMNWRYTEKVDINQDVMLIRGDLSNVFTAGNILFFPLKLIIKDKRIYDYEESVYDKIRMLRLKFSEIKIGDYVVHKDFGIGVYKGLRKMSTDGGIQDYIVIEYRDKRLLYLPALSIDMISKYEGIGGRTPEISSLGKTQWQKKKLRIKEELIKFASEILRIKAERRLIKKEPITISQELYDEFCDGFEYDETPDQLRCIEEVKRDLLREFPMERIVCGDVGFGKTEIILRASFIVAMAGYQVVVLVPTTILAEQHFNNFRERFSKFPIKIEMLSRFVPAKKAVDIKKGIREGKVDIVIGTHKVLTNDVQFKNLRLLVIDEEHKFGVEQKERLKRENPAMDVLITTATPIPRTLHMGFANLMDLSVLTTAPEGRIPVRTVIARFDEELIRNAIIKEVKRGGQVFFVNPRISTINNMASHLSSLLPGLKIAVAHGRMPADKIETVMHDFYNKKYDLLVSTNIIGAGLDFPNVNTIIVDSAELFGLSELYQLRGRVGRRKVNAYAYFLFSSISAIKRDVRKKMDILYRHQGLGAGFNIASEDLELRGAGELLGKKQSGFIEGIGFDLYNELLEDAIDEIQGIQINRFPEPEIRIDLPIYIPDDYIDDVSLRFNFYHRFAAARSFESVDDLLNELVDRFGEYPKEVSNLAELTRIKIMAREMWIRCVERHKSSISIIFDSRAKIDTKKILPFLERYHRQVKINPDSKIIISTAESDDIFATLRDWLYRLSEIIEPPAIKT